MEDLKGMRHVFGSSLNAPLGDAALVRTRAPRAGFGAPTYSLLVAALLAGSLLFGPAACTPVGTPGGMADVAFPPGWSFPAEEPPVVAPSGMVASTDEYASEVGVRIMEAGGNAVDAAIAVAFALAVVNPEAGNIGGGGFMVVRLADGATAALDFREKAPLAATVDMFLDAEGKLTDLSTRGHLASGVPGSVAGLWEAHRRFGTVQWAELVAPAMELAEGFQVRERQANQFRIAERRLRSYPATEATFLPDGKVPEVGSWFRQPELAATLGRIAARGKAGFYEGRTADLLVEEMRRGGGIITHQDLEGYEAVWRQPIEVSYRGHTLISMPPPSSGGAILAAAAKILEGFDLGAMGHHSPEHLHLLVETWRRVYADRNTYMADPDFVEMPLARLTSDEYAAERRATISLDRATPSEEVGPGLGPFGPGATTHFSVVDPMGNAVALTTTINSFFGSLVTVEGAGFLLNNEMDDFSALAGAPNQFGLVQWEANAIEPGKRMLSSMSPTIVVGPNGELLLAVGSMGGSTIITQVIQQISNVVDFGMGIQQAVNAPRIHHQHLPDRIQYEPGALRPEIVEALRAMGHQLQERSRDSYMGDVHAILRLSDGRLAGASDPRRGGAAAGF
jgi:gamma-glutamyltranspeptidase / glutathione hydrolase